MKPVGLTTLRGGINRLKVKGGARADSLYDLTNAYRTQAGTVVPREGTIRNATLTANSVGLATFNSQLNVFATSLQAVPAGYVCNLLIHPTNPAATLTKIWFAKPFMGFPYVVAQFSTGEVFHYWLQSNGPWAASTVYKIGTIVTPLAAPNGLAFQAVRDLAPFTTWQAQMTVAVNQIVEPNQYTGFAYKAIAVQGTNPHTGSTEPVFPTAINGIVQEFGDFDTSSSSSGTTQVPPSSSAAAPLGKNITDRYGNAQTILNQAGTAGTASTSVQASTTVTVWAPGTLYAPGAVVQPSTGQGAFINAVPDGDFESGVPGSWVLSAANVTFSNTGMYQGNFCIKFALDHDTQTVKMANFGVVNAGQSVTVSAYLNPNNSGSNTTMTLQLMWYDAADTFISSTDSAGQQGGGYRKVSVTGNAPVNAKHVRVQIKSSTGTTPNPSFADLVTWSLETAAAVSNFLFEAVQVSAGTSAGTEPAWPTTAGNTVVDKGVTWKAVGTSIITWQAIPIMQSGAAEPVWPTTVGNSVKDNNMSWVCINRQIKDIKNPNSIAVCLAASHVFQGNKDICPFSAVVDPTDYTSANNAGFLPTGLNNYGDNPVAVLGLYRSNLIVMNAGGYQMWQVDPDPANMALLDAQPVGSTHTRAAQSVANDMIFLTEVGFRNIGTAGATANLQVGGTGEPIDPLVKAQLQANVYDPLSLYYPGRGQYWGIFGPQAFVLTVNGQGVKSWSRYIFPDSITDWCLLGEVLYLRTAGNLVWQLDYNTLQDDVGGAPVSFNSTIQWPYLDAGALGINKMLVGVDLVGTGACTLQLAWNQQDSTTFSDDPGFATSQNVTPPFNVGIADTVPGEPIPLPMTAPSYSVILTFNSNQPGLKAKNSASWEWDAASMYVTDAGGGGATG